MHTKNGFTLIELAIALMVIGLLIGGVLKGQELIENARLTALVRNINSYKTAVMIFQSTYNYLPGDMRKPERIPNCTARNCYLTSASSGNGLIDAASERSNFFMHLSYGGFITPALPGDPGLTASSSNAHLYYPASPYDGEMSCVYGYAAGIFPSPYTPKDAFNALNTGSGNCGTYLSISKVARPLDEKTDDGNPYSGDIITVGLTTASDICIDTTTSQYTNNTARACRVYIDIK